MLTIPALVLLGAACLIVFAVNRPTSHVPKTREYRGHRAFCFIVFAVGCIVRLALADRLPSGISAEEALVGVQAKALWQTGGFFPAGGLTTVLPQWEGEPTGPLLAALAAPFVGIFGITPITTRLPLVLLSIAAMPAAYALGCKLSGKAAGRFLLVVYALCPYFVLGARMTCGANAAVFMLPIAVALLVGGLERSALLYAGMAALSLSAYSQTIMLIIAPVAVIGAAAVALVCGKSRLHALLSAVLGLALCWPAVMTVYVNLNGLSSRMLFGMVDIPSLGLFSDNLFSDIAFKTAPVYTAAVKLWAAVIGGLFQAVSHENIKASLYLPDGMLALTVVSLPLMILGAGVLVLRRIDGKKSAAALVGSRTLMIVLFIIVLACVTVFGDDGSIGIGGEPDVFDHAILFFFAALLMTAGWRQVLRRSHVGARLLAALLAVCFAGLGVHLFGGSYQAGANTYFDGFAQAAVRAQQLQQQTNSKVYVTSRVYPHIQPDAAAEMMYLYATDADMSVPAHCEVIYALGVERVDPSQIYLVNFEDTYTWDYDDMHWEEFGEFLVLSPNAAE